MQEMKNAKKSKRLDSTIRFGSGSGFCEALVLSKRELKKGFHGKIAHAEKASMERSEQRERLPHTTSKPNLGNSTGPKFQICSKPKKITNWQ